MKKFDVCLLWVPYDNGEGGKRRPGLVLADGIVCPISAITSREPISLSDYQIIDYKEAGLDHASTVRFDKIVPNVKENDVDIIGHLSDADIKNIIESHYFNESYKISRENRRKQIIKKNKHLREAQKERLKEENGEKKSRNLLGIKHI